MADVRFATTIGPKDAGDITAALKSIGDTDTKTVVYIGVIHGTAHGVSYRSNKYSDEPSIAMVGVFEAVPYDPQGTVVRASSLYLNAAVQTMLTKAMMGETPAPTNVAPKLGKQINVDLGLQMPVKAEIGVVRSAGEGVGYRYVINMIGALVKIDALETTRQAMIAEGSDRVKQIANANREYSSAPEIAGIVPKQIAKGPKKGGKKK